MTVSALFFLHDLFVVLPQASLRGDVLCPSALVDVCDQGAALLHTNTHTHTHIYTYVIIILFYGANS
jgi:hypothetical protein